MLMYAKCSRSPWFLQIPAEDDEGEGRAKVGNEDQEVTDVTAFLTRQKDHSFIVFLLKIFFFPLNYCPSLKTRSDRVFVLICVHFHLSSHEALEGF